MAERSSAAPTEKNASTSDAAAFAAPQISLPKGGGAIRDIGEKFSANPVTGTGSLSVPIAVSPGRSGFSPQLSLSYDSGAGNGPFGLGWNLSLPSITRRTDRGLPQYRDREESDTFILSGAEDLVRVLTQDSRGQWIPDTLERDGCIVTRYRPRIEGLFSRIERWTRSSDGDTYWRSISKNNVTTSYGKTPESRVADPDDRSRAFAWLICESSDDKGNSIVYEYAAEDSQGIDRSQINERNRSDLGRTANRYLKRIKYGNTASRLVQPDVTRLSWLFELVFDYGEGHYTPQPADADGREFVDASLRGNQTWPVRQDPFSNRRPGFEVRTCRLCRGVLVFHHFADELGTPDCLVRATEFAYVESPVASFMTGVTHSGFVRQSNGRYLKRSMPPVEFEYSQAHVQWQVNEVDQESLTNIPASVNGQNYQWLDLDGEGLQCVLAEQEGNWYYKRNLSPLTHGFTGDQPTTTALFEPLSQVTRLPGFANASTKRHQFMDLAGDGHLDCLVLDRSVGGFFARTEDEDWDDFRPLRSIPNVDWNDPNLRFIDLNGDGFADVLVTEGEVFTWYPSLAEAGFDEGIRISKMLDEEDGPAIVFADGTQTMYLADMTGDGLADIVRIRNGEVCYWPNLGYCRFGRKFTMDQAPWFDRQELFDPRRVKLADIDGSGTTDVIYLASDSARIYFNQSGNSWSLAEAAQFPQTDDVSSVQALDLLGNGTACLVWTSPLPGDARQNMRYIDLMGGQKPHLLVRSRNNLGAETHVFYSPSTKFYLADRQAGRPWVTRLPFPVQVVERVETCDRVSRNRFVTRYAYHHGYFDGIEREFRGFGMVEQQDTEELGALSQAGAFPDSVNIDAASYVPPILTKTWFHTGAYPQGGKVSRVFEKEYYRESDLSEGLAGLTDAEFAAMELPDTVLPPGLTSAEMREAVRSLKGAVLRQEVYALDGTDEADRPYSVSEQNYTVKPLQTFGANRHAVFFTHARESIDFHYERKLYDIGGRQLADPRVTHNLVLAIDDYGNPLQSASVAYGRRHDDPDPLLSAEGRAAQKAIQATYTESAYTNPVLASDAYRPPQPAETRTYELNKVTPDGNRPSITNLFTFEELAQKVALASDGQHDLPYEDLGASGATERHPYRRLIEHVRTLYRKDDLSAGLPLGSVEPLALPYQNYKLALTPALLSLYQRDGQNLLPNRNSVLRGEGGYVAGDDQKLSRLFPSSDGGGLWWIPSGQAFFSPDAADTAATELANAKTHFFLPRRFRDPFGNSATVLYDGYDFLLLETEDALHNKITVGERNANGSIVNGNDYRGLQPALVTDPNGNRSQAAFDGLGLVAGTAVMGKTSEGLGDSLAGFVADLTQAQIDQFFADPKGPAAASLLQGATSRIVYDLGRFLRLASMSSPSYAASVVRETHASDLAQGQVSKLQVSFSYSDGFGREIQKKIQAEAGPLVPGNPAIDPRWVASGWTIFNNKGKPVRKYEPFFDDTHDFKFGVTVGVSPVLFYDPAERVVATLHPDRTWEKVVFDPWRQETWDVNDTVLVVDPKTDPDVGDFFPRLPDADYLPTWHAQRQGGALGPQEQAAALKAAVHSATPTVAHLDSLGRSFLTIAHNRFKLNDAPLGDPPSEEFYSTRVLFDIEGNQRAIIDAKGRVVMRYDYDMLSHRIHQASMEAGERWMLNDVAGKPARAWDSRGHQVRAAYDALRRPAESYLSEGLGPERLVERTVFGEAQPNPEAANLRGKPFQHFDQAGVVTSDQYDFKGNLLRSQRQLAGEYKATLDWSAAVPLEAPIYASRTRYDALNRPRELIAPDNSVIHPIYNEANLLDQVEANLRGAAATTPFVDNIDYDAKGQRTLIEYGNGASTTYAYDPDTFRLTHLQTTSVPPAGFSLLGLIGVQPQVGSPQSLQDLSYTYDPAGNITHIQDDAQQTVFFRNRRVEPSADYTYDAIYRLIEAAGREHLGQTGGQPDPPTAPDAFDAFRTRLDHPGDGNAMGTYVEQYVYDAVGNILAMQHRGSDPVNPGWTRTYTYQEDSLVEPGKKNNRLSTTTIGATTETYRYDGSAGLHGNITAMLHLPLMRWDYRDQLQATAQQVVSNGGTPETTWYVYDSAGQRVRKVTESQAAAGITPSRMKERIYLGGFEIYRECNGNGTTVTLERETLHIMDDKRRIALVETRTQGSDGSPAQLIRYQFGNHLGSASLELDDKANIISYEEFYPYGSTSYQAVDKSLKAAAKRYRYTGKERDEENGFTYHGARYYAPWLGRWASVDPSDGKDLQRSPYVGMGNNPQAFVDPGGRQETAPSPQGFTQMLGPTYPNRAEWERRALQSAGIDINQWQPSRGFEQNRQILERVYAYYTRLFGQNETLMWAGMAKLAGGEILRGLEEAQQTIAAARFAQKNAMWGEPGERSFVASMNLQASYARTLQNRLLQMQKDIFLDLAWQHQAYVEGGLSALEIARSGGAKVPIEAWRDIASGDQGRVRGGNRALLRREQGTILPSHYAAIRDIPDFDVIPWMMSGKALSPIPGGRPFEAVVPGGDITEFRDRWRWIESDMLPAYERLSPERRRQLVNTSLTTLSHREFPAAQVGRPQLQLQP